MRIKKYELILSMAVLMLACGQVWAAPGDLDTSFGGGDGWVTTGTAASGNVDDVRTMLQQADGKLVVAGTSIVRFNTDGTLDTSFSGDGKIAASVFSMTQQPDGKLFFANSGGDAYFFRRYDLDGLNDVTFASNGYGEYQVSCNYGGCASINAMLRLDNGAIVLAGSRWGGPPMNSDAQLFQVQCTTGSWYCSSPMSYFSTRILNYADNFTAMIQQMDGKILAVGRWWNSSASAYRMMVYRFYRDGGIAASLDGTDSYTPTAVIEQSDGKLLLTFGNYKLERFNNNLTLDASFGVGGRVLATDIGFTVFGSRNPVLQQSDGKLVVAGGNTVARLNIDGSLDATFGSGGKQTLIVPGGGTVSISSIVEQTDGRLVAGGYATGMATGQEFYVARLENDDLDTDFDGLTDKFDSDDDNDGVLDVNDAFPLDASESVDTDGDGTGNNADTDDDNDGVADTADKFPLDAARWQRVRHNTDFDNDSDILVRSASLGSWTRYSVQNNAIVGNGVMNAPTSSDSVYVAQLDANGDGDADILTRSASTGAWTLSIVESGAVTSSIPLYLYANLGYVFVGVGDFNNDGTDDVMLRHAVNGYRVFLLQNHAVSTSVYYNAWTGTSSVDQGIGDFNGDGTDDLLVRRTSDNLYFIFKTINGAVSNYYCACNIWSNTAWTFQFAGDTNKDGKDDIIIRGTGPTADGKWWAFRMNNFVSTAYSNLNLFINKTAITVGAVGDYNGDGNLDVLTRVNNSTTYVSPIVNGTVTGNYLLYNFTTDQVIGR